MNENIFKMYLEAREKVPESISLGMLFVTWSEIPAQYHLRSTKPTVREMML